MRPQELQAILKHEPFQPFRMTLTDGRTYDIRHPEQVMVLRGVAVIATQGEDPADDILDYGTMVSLLHVMQIQYFDLKKDAKPGNGKKKNK